MKIGIIRYPGSNCDFDTLNYFEDSFFIWHKETNCNILTDLDLLVIPGGFAFGDRIYNKATENYTISPGTMAIKSPVTVIIKEAAKRKIPILGICNGFQILTQLNLLPGKLLLNKTKKFVCKQVECWSINTSIKKTKMYIANSYGRYVSDVMPNKTNIFLRYSEHLPEYDNNIAGICNDDKTIFGMMPHPERNNDDFKDILYKLIFSTNHPIHTQLYFQKKISELMNSEHISYKSTRKYLKKLFTTAPWVVQGPGENAGIVDIGDGYCIALRIESHNHPTYINPFEGAATGVGGILRDIFTMGARPIAILDFLRFGSDENSDYLLKKTIEGISYYGNCVGVPNVGGDLYIDDSYNKNPLVNVACLGIVKKENIIYGNAKNRDDVLIYVGSKTGNEGIGGAAMASKSFTKNIDTSKLQHNVQKSDPFLEKLLLEACCEIAESGLAVGMQDMGAGGLLCASLEVVLRGREKTDINMGCDIQLDRVPTKYDMDPCDILTSESQERMLIVSNLKNISEILYIFDKWDLEHSVIGCVNTSGEYKVKYNDKLLYKENITNFKDITDNTYNPSNKRVLGSSAKKVKNIKQWSVYDSTVGNRTIKGPDKPGSYTIIDIYENNKQLFLTWGGTVIECYNAMINFDGVKPLCVVNCLNFGHPKDSMNSFSHTIDKMTRDCKKLTIPVVGGNVSLYNATDGKSIRPTPIILMMGIS